MSDLISRRKLLEIFNHDLKCFETGSKTETQMYINVADVRKMIQEQPTVCKESNINVFNILREKIAERAEKLTKNFEKRENPIEVRAAFLNKLNELEEVGEIVKEVEEKFATDTNVGNNGWIPVSERLPEEYETDECYKSLGIWKKSDWVLVTGKFRDTNIVSMTYTVNRGVWPWGEIFAWQPLPQPYEKGVE